MDENVILPIILTSLAGLSTGLGALIVLFTRSDNYKFLSFSMGFSAGVMIFVSFVELIPVADTVLLKSYSPFYKDVILWGSFFMGIAIIGVIDRLVPKENNPHEPAEIDLIRPHNGVKSKLKRTGLVTAIAIAIHNFPEGISTFITAYQDIELGFVIAFAVALHNIPEGIAVAMPIYHSSGSRKKAIWHASLSGLSEPLGAILAYWILKPYINDLMLGVMYGVVSGIMVFISLDELLPRAREYGHHHLAIWGAVIGMFVFIGSLLLIR